MSRFPLAHCHALRMLTHGQSLTYFERRYMSYLVVKRVTLKANGNEYRKGAVLTAELVGVEKIKSYLAKGYIMPVSEPPADIDEGIDLLTPEEVAALDRKDLVAYAKSIGVEFKQNISSPALKKLVNEYIDGLDESDTEDGDEDGDEDDEDNG